MNKLPEDFDIKKTFLYRHCLEHAKYIDNKELELNLERELRIAYENYPANAFCSWDWETYLDDGFTWLDTPQGEAFWLLIFNGNCPKEYED